MDNRNLNCLIERKRYRKWQNDKFIEEILVDLKYIPQSFIDNVAKILLNTHSLKNDYSNATQKDINKRINELDKLIQKEYQDLLKNPTPSVKEQWKENYNLWKEEKEALRIQQVSIDKADDNFYEISNTIINFCKNAHNFFISATPSQKRTICEILGSNFSANGKKLSITLHSVFNDIIEANKSQNHQPTRLELAETQAGIKKEPTKEALNLNGGTDEARTRDLLRDRQAL